MRLSKSQRAKGQRGEREAAALLQELTGWKITRRVRQYDGDSDLEGIPGWSVEVKNHATATLADVAGWWRQAVAQAGEKLPLLIYKRQRGEWRAVWPVAAKITEQRAEYWDGYEWTAETSLQAWAAVARELQT